MCATCSHAIVRFLLLDTTLETTATLSLFNNSKL